MRLRSVLFAAPADRQLSDILAESEKSFGRDARKRYEGLVVQALEDLLEHQARPGEGWPCRAPRHLIVARIVGDKLLVLAFGHDGMVDGLISRIDEAEG